MAISLSRNEPLPECSRAFAAPEAPAPREFISPLPGVATGTEFPSGHQTPARERVGRPPSTRKARGRGGAPGADPSPGSRNVTQVLAASRRSSGRTPRLSLGPDGSYRANSNITPSHCGKPRLPLLRTTWRMQSENGSSIAASGVATRKKAHCKPPPATRSKTDSPLGSSTPPFQLSTSASGGGPKKETNER